MKTVEIYIETSFKGPVVREGKYAAILVFTKADGQLHTAVVSGKEEESTYNRCTLLAAIHAMEELKYRCHVVIYMDNSYVRNMIEQENPEKWRRAEWKRAAGKTVHNQDLWEMFLGEKEKHEVEVRLGIAEEFFKDTLQAVINGEEIRDV